MRNWRDELLQSIQPQRGSSLFIAVDPDGLLLDEQFTTRLSAMNVEILFYNDPVDFRYVFETHFRAAISQGETSLLIRMQTEETIPYDILQQGQIVTFHASDLFPRLAGVVLRQLNTRDFDALYPVYTMFRGSDTSRDTLDFLLRHVYKIPYDLIETEADAYPWLISLHVRQDPLPSVVETFFIQQLEEKPQLQSLPLREWVQSPDAFYGHLQDEWQRYLQHVLPGEREIKEGNAKYDADERQQSAHSHPFSMPDVRGWINDLFIEGHLQPIAGMDIEQLPSWTHVGVRDDSVRDQQTRLQTWIRRLQERLPEIERYQDWLETARLFGVMKQSSLSMRNQISEETMDAVEKLEQKLDHAFTEWMLTFYQGLPSLPHLPGPVMVHHIPHYLASAPYSKVALIVMDGMSVVQWAQIKQELEEANVQLAEHAVFAWVPTLTSVSRQALFSGQMPLYFADSLWSTHKEKQLWARFWEDRGVSRQSIAYERNLGQEAYDRHRFRFLTNARIRVAGLVINTIDKLTHGAIQGHEGMQAELSLWLQKEYLRKLLQDLQEAGFTTFLTSDHGNKACTGIGSVSDGVFVETKGERVRIYDDHTRYQQRAEQLEAVKWPNIGLPHAIYPLIASGNQAFTQAGVPVVSHGGASLEEVIVPFVQVTGMG